MSKPISFRVSEEMRIELESRATLQNMNLTTYIKQILEKEFNTEEFKKINDTRGAIHTDIEKLRVHAEQTTSEILEGWERMNVTIQSMEVIKKMSNTKYWILGVCFLQICTIIPLIYFSIIAT